MVYVGLSLSWGRSTAQGSTAQEEWGLSSPSPHMPELRRREARLRGVSPSQSPVINHEHVFNDYLKLLAECPSWKACLSLCQAVEIEGSLHIPY